MQSRPHNQLLEHAEQRMNRAIEDVTNLFDQPVTDAQAIAVTRIANALNTISTLLIEGGKTLEQERSVLQEASDLLWRFGERVSVIDNDWTKLAQDCARK